MPETVQIGTRMGHIDAPKRQEADRIQFAQLTGTQGIRQIPDTNKAKMVSHFTLVVVIALGGLWFARRGFRR